MEEAQREKEELVKNMAVLQQEKEQLEAEKESVQKECEQEKETCAQLRRENQVSGEKTRAVSEVQIGLLVSKEGRKIFGLVSSLLYRLVNSCCLIRIYS